MATVYRAFDPQLGREVAVKVMHGAFTGRGDIERRFRREAQAVAALKHEGIVDVFDFAPGGDGEPAYIVSELIEGSTLRGYLEGAGGKVLPEIAVAIAARVAGALGAAHVRGIVHRDVKPDNVMVDLGASVRVLLTDFGIARMTEDDTMTATGSILGSPSYMSPEQAKSATITPASDVFSLGVTLYQLVTGRMPFPGKDPLTVIAALVAGEFLRPSQVEARVAPELEAVIVRCLRRAPGERYADGNEAAAALRELAANAPLGGVSEGEALRRFREDRVALEREVGPRVADAAVERARGCVRRNELSRALAHLNRALAYVPDHRGATALLDQISSRRRWVKGAAVAGAVLLVAGGVAAGLRAARAPATTPVVEKPAPTVVAPAPRPRVVAPAPPVVAPTPEAVVAPPPSRAAAPARKRGKQAAPPAPSVATPIAAAPPPAEEAPPSPPPAAAPPPAPSGPAATAGITLRARQGFCSPSLDERPPALRPIYQGVEVGTHTIHCTLPGGERVRVGTFELRAGTHPDLIVVRGADGRPTLGRPE
jgi:serine/threonine-protein kinase